MQSGLVSAYKSTDYVTRDSGCTVVIRIGHHSLVVDRLLAKAHVRNGAFITAWNPFFVTNDPERTRRGVVQTAESA
jgi:hypothetical protein